jgi:D-alanyl-D-alanine dipeptidase
MTSRNVLVLMTGPIFKKKNMERRNVYFIVILNIICASFAQIPEGFVHLSDVDNSIIQEIRYYTLHNFVGGPMMGYDRPECILTTQAAAQLSKVQQGLLKMNPPFSLKVYDCYRPQMAVDQFVLWSSNPDFLMKDEFYPTLNKSELFPEGYIARNSSHSRGSTMDLTIVPYPPPQEEQYVRGMPLFPCISPVGTRFGDNSIDMGTGFDCFHPLAHTENPQVIGIQRKNREFLKSVMEAQGFVNYAGEWWHYTLHNEPFPTTFFNFVIE